MQHGESKCWMTVAKRKYSGVCKRREHFERGWSEVTSWEKWDINPVFRVGRRILHTDSTDSDHLHQQRGAVAWQTQCYFTAVTSGRPSPGYSASPPSVHTPPSPPPSICSSLFSAQLEAAPHPAPCGGLRGGTGRKEEGEVRVCLPQSGICAEGPPQRPQLSPRHSISFPDCVLGRPSPRPSGVDSFLFF